MTIEDLEKEGIRIGIFPQYINRQWLWTVGIYYDNQIKAIWIDSDNGLPRACYKTYNEALNEALKYCKKHGKK